MQQSQKRQRVMSATTMGGVAEDGHGGGNCSGTGAADKATAAPRYNDPATADVVLHLVPAGELSQALPAADVRAERSPPQEYPVVPDCTDASVPASSHAAAAGSAADAGRLTLYLHKAVLTQCRYFAARLSGRWQQQDSTGDSSASAADTASTTTYSTTTSTATEEDGQQQQQHPQHPQQQHLSMAMSPAHTPDAYATTLELLYTRDFLPATSDVQSALSILPVAAELLFDDCIGACVDFLESVPWTRREEAQIVDVVSCLQLEQSAHLLARLRPVQEHAVSDMLDGLVYLATHSLQNVASVKAFVAKVLSTYASREAVRSVLDKAFSSSLKTVQDAIEEWSSPNVRGRHDEIEALQRQNLRTADTYSRHLLWLVERMVELKVASNAVIQWSEPGSFTSNLEKAFGETAGRNVAPGLPSSLLRCTCRLANAVAAGSIVASRQVRLNLVKGWLPVLIVSRENTRTDSKLNTRASEQELEEVFLRIILTLPMTDAQGLLQQCLSFATRTVDECPHLVAAFNTWFRRAGERGQSARESGEEEH